MHRFCLGLLAALAFTHVVLAARQAAASSERFALVIGNADYATVQQLNNPVNDAQLIGQTLVDLEFDVTLALDLSYDQMRAVIRDFGEKLETHGASATALVFYAGHAVQLDGANYLLPTDALISDESDISVDGLRLDMILHQIDHAKPAASFVILDACRDNPFGAAVNLVPGLARTGAPRDTLLAFSTAPGAVALDGVGTNSPYSAALAASMKAQGVTVEEMFKNVRRAVLSETNGAQTPWESSSLTRSVSFDPEEVSANVVVVSDPTAFWDNADWEEMTPEQRGAWEVLGWSEKSWAGTASPPETEDVAWPDLKGHQRQAARSLGYTSETWSGND